MAKRTQLLGAVTLVFGLSGATSAAEAGWFDFARSSQPQVAGGEVVQLAQAADPDRLNRIEAQIRSLTGQIEELSYQLLQLQTQLRLIQEDSEFRFRDLETGSLAETPQTPPRQVGPSTIVVQPLASGAIATLGATGTPPVAPVQPSAGAVPTFVPPAPVVQPQFGSQPLDLSALARGGAVDDATSAPATVAPPVAPAPIDEPSRQVAVAAPSGDPNADFYQAYDLMNAGQYALAELSFRQFLETYPSSEAAPDAQYWLGESLFARASYRDAADAFRAGYKAYPTSSRAPATLLRLGQALAGIEERDAACQVYAQVLKEYPAAPESLQQRVKYEQAGARC